MLRRVMVVGVSSYVGSALAAGLRDEFEVFGTYYRHPVYMPNVFSMRLNCMDGGQVIDMLKTIKPDVIIYCAGLTTPEQCKKQPQKSNILNFQAPSVFVKAGHGKLFIYLSTHSLFSGNPKMLAEPPFTEDDPVDPITDFAQTKFRCENSTVLYKAFGQVMRLSPVYGENCNLFYAGPKDWGDSVTWYSAILNSLEKGQPIKLLKDHFVTPLYIGDLVRAVRKYIKRPPDDASIYHLGSDEPLSYYDMGLTVAKVFGYNEKLISPIESIGPDGEDLKLSVNFNTSLDSSKFQEQYTFGFKSFEAGVTEYRNRLRSGDLSNWQS